MDSVKWASPQANAHFTQSVYELCNRMSHRFSPIDTLKHFLRNKLGGYIVAIKDIRTNNLLYRGVSCPERPSTIDRVSYPPADKITKLGLVNRIGTSMFYCSAAGKDMAQKIIPHIPVWEKSDRQDGIFSRSDFYWDRKRGAYICPNGKLLQTSGTVHAAVPRLKAGLRCVLDTSEVLHHGRCAQDPARPP